MDRTQKEIDFNKEKMYNVSINRINEVNKNKEKQMTDNLYIPIPAPQPSTPSRSLGLSRHRSDRP